MSFFRRIKFGKRTTTRGYSLSESATPMAPISDVVDDVDEDEIDYSPCVQQEAAGILLQKNQRMMIEEKIENLRSWSTEHKTWKEKHKRLLQTKDSSFQSYVTTLNLFKEAFSLCDQIDAEFDESRKELEKVLRKIPKRENPSIKSELGQEYSIVKEEKRKLDALENERRRVKVNLDRTLKDLGSSRPDTLKHSKLQDRQESFIQDRKRLRQQIKKQQETYQQAQNQCRTNTENIYQQSQKKELARLKDIPDSLKNFITALKIDPDLLENTIQKHNPETDLTSWREKHFSPSFKQTEV